MKMPAASLDNSGLSAYWQLISSIEMQSKLTMFQRRNKEIYNAIRVLQQTRNSNVGGLLGLFRVVCIMANLTSSIDIQL